MHQQFITPKRVAKSMIKDIIIHILKGRTLDDGKRLRYQDLMA